MPDFYGMLIEQCTQVARTTGLLVEFMETGNPKSVARFGKTSTRPTG
jgi:hypothetical protein